MAAFVPTKLNQAALDGIKRSFQGVTLSNVTPAPVAANSTVQAQGVAPKTNGVPAPQAVPFKPTVLNQAAQDALKQNLQGVTFSNIAPVAANTALTPQPKADPALVAQHQAAADAFKAANWYNGGTTATPSTQAQNLAAVINQPGNPVAANPTPFITNTLTQAAKDTQAQQVPKPVGTFNPPSSAGDSTAPVSAPLAASSTTPAPAAPASSFPGQLTSAQIAAEAQARIDKQRAAITSATAAANAARKNVFDYTNQITGDNRTLENGAFNETHDPFTGQTGYAQAQLQRNRSIQDTANNNAYQADITANNQKVADFETLAPEQQQAAIDEMTRIEREYGLQVGQLTGQFNGQATLAKQGQDAQYTGMYNGQPTLQAQNQNFNQGIAQAGVTGQYNGAPTLAASQQGFQDRLAYGQATGTFSNGQQTLASQTAMAQLTGKMPDGTPTNAAQQQQLTNQWTLADQTGTIPNSLADFYGLPHGMQTQAAKNQAAQLGISQQNATNSANSSTNSNNNAKINQLMEVWKNTGVAPAGLESVGVKQGDKYTGGNPSSTGNFNLDDYKGHINSVFYSNEPSDPNDPLSPKTKVFDKESAQKYVDSLNLPKDQKNQLYQIYGLQAVSDSDISQYLK